MAESYGTKPDPDRPETPYLAGGSTSQPQYPASTQPYQQQSSAPGYPQPQPYDTSGSRNPYPEYPNGGEQRDSAGIRFLKSLGVAALVCMLFSFLSGSVGAILGSGSHGWDRGLDGWPIPGQYRTVDCVSGDAWKTGEHSVSSKLAYPRERFTTFDIPVSSSRLFILERGSLSSGSVTVETTDAVRRTAHFEVRLHYRNDKALNHANVCLLRRREGENGIGVFTPTRWWHRQRDDGLYFDIKVTIPASGTIEPLYIKDFKSDLSDFVYHIDLPRDDVSFDSFSLVTTNSPIYVEDVSANKISVESSNGPIRGAFNASDSIKLATSNAIIRAAVTLSDDASDDDSAYAEIKTSNAPIESAFNLHTRRSRGGDFRIEAVTSNNRLDLSFPSSPVDSTLYLKGETSNGPAAVSLNPAYEGGFTLRTSQFTPGLEKNKRIDPSGRGRPREVWTTSSRKGFVQGSVEWVPSGDGRPGSHVDVKTSNAAITLKL